MLTEKPQTFEEKPLPVRLCPPKVLHGPVTNRNQASAVRGTAEWFRKVMKLRYEHRVMWCYLSRTARTEGNSTHIFQDRLHIQNSMEIHYVAWERQAVMKLPLFVQCMKQCQNWVKLISCISCSAVTQTLKRRPWCRIAAFWVISLFCRGTPANPEYFVHGWSKNFSASTIDGNNIGKIFFS